MRMKIFCNEIGSDWWIVLTPQISDGVSPEYFEDFEAALEGLVNRLNEGLIQLGEPGRVSLERSED